MSQGGGGGSQDPDTQESNFDDDSLQTSHGSRQHGSSFYKEGERKPSGPQDQTGKDRYHGDTDDEDKSDSEQSKGVDKSNYKQPRKQEMEKNSHTTGSQGNVEKRRQ